jgi:isorenieratene synthase
MLHLGETPTESPILPARPTHFLDAVVRQELRCEPEDVIANRLDPWHGAHFHSHSFARLRVMEQDDESITVRVVYRIYGRIGMEVDARFHCPEPRTIVMTIVAGEGVGSVVETHATPIGQGRTAMIEATLASSSRPSMAWLPRAAFLRGMVHARAARLWKDDAEYCERTYALRTRGKQSLTIASSADREPVLAE